MEGALDMHEVTVLSHETWDRITHQTTARQSNEDRLRQEREARLALHALSLDQIEPWTDTVLVSSLVACT